MKRSAIFWGGLIILIGILLLLNTLGIISVNVWALVFSIFIIALGAWILWGTFGRRSLEVENVNVSMETATRVKAQIRHGAGRLQIKSGADAGSLISGTCVGGATIQSRINQEVHEVSLNAPNLTTPWFNWGPGYSLDWNLNIAQGIPLEIIVDSGASDTRIDLSELLVTKIALNSGASSTWITMPARAGLTKGVFKTGAASLELIIPAGVAARIRTSGALASIKVDLSRFPRSGGFYQSADYDTAVNKIDMQVETGVGSVDIR
jgi:hypothetical protein